MAEKPLNTEHEEWRPVLNWEGVYEVSNRGRVRSIARTRLRSRRNGPSKVNYPSKILKGWVSSTGYMCVDLRDMGRLQKVKIHRLVCEAWHGPSPAGMECAHGDGNRTNNRPENLRWATHAENMRDMIKHGTAHGRDMQSQAKITSKELGNVLRRFKVGDRNVDIARDYSVSPNTISGLRREHMPETLMKQKTRKDFL